MHPRQPPLESELEASWLEALTDAGVDPDTALLYPFEGRRSAGPGAYGAYYLTCSFQLQADEGAPPEIEAIVDEINHDECIPAARIFVWTERTAEGTAALVRHELEHELQVEANGRDLLDLQKMAEHVISERIGGLAGGAFLYQALPHELDANAAAAAFVRERYGSDRINELLQAGDEDSSAFRSLVGPPPRDSLPTRIILFLAAHQDLCELVARRAGAAENPRALFAQLLNQRWAGAGTLWRRLVEDDDLRLT
jgi:hypothetical protein